MGGRVPGGLLRGERIPDRRVLRALPPQVHGQRGEDAGGSGREVLCRRKRELLL